MCECLHTQIHTHGMVIVCGITRDFELSSKMELETSKMQWLRQPELR